MDYLLYGYEGLLPDIIGFGPVFYKIFKDYSFDPKDSLIGKIHSDKMTKRDWFLYDISHSLLPRLFLLLITKNKVIYAAIIDIVFDIFLHSEEYKG